MRDRYVTGKIVDEIIQFAAVSTAVSTALVLPNILIGLDKPLKLLYKTLDKREREREAKRAVYYMKSRGYLAGSYEHGLQLTEKAIRRLKSIELSELHIRATPAWDSAWRIVIYDVPERKKAARNALHDSLRRVGCFQLQRSVWITPFPCRDIIETISAQYEVNEHVSYFEALHLDNEKEMIRYFKKKYPTTRF